MKFARRNKRQVHIQSDAADTTSCAVSRSSRRSCVDDMFNKLKESNVEPSPVWSSVDPLRLKLMMSLSLAEESAQSDEGLMKVKRLRSKLLSNFVRIDEAGEASDASYVSWNSQSAVGGTCPRNDSLINLRSHKYLEVDQEMGCEVIDHSTPDHNISAIRINEYSPESPKYNPSNEDFQVTISTRVDSSMDEYLDHSEPGFEVSTNDKLSRDYIHHPGKNSNNGPTVCDDSDKEVCGISSFSDSNISEHSSDYFDRDMGCGVIDDCGLIETTTDASYVGIEITIQQ